MKEKQKIEAIKRLMQLKLESSVLKEFKDDGTIYYSERIKLGNMPAGILYWMRNSEEFMKQVKEFEENTNALVYHATHEYMEFGECLTLLFVSPYEEEWEMDHELFLEGDSKEGYPQYAKVINLTVPNYSEYGIVMVKEAAGGLIRTA